MTAEELGEMKISIFKNVETSRTPISSDYTIRQFITQANDKLKEYCNVLRNEKKHSPLYDRIKSHCLPCATLSCTCDYRDVKHIMTRNPILVIDIDYDPESNTNLWLSDSIERENKKRFLFDLPYVYSIKESCSGTGLYAIVLLDSNEDDNDLLEHFLSIEEEFKKYDIVIDKACKDTVRLRIISSYVPMIKTGNIEEYTGRIKQEIKNFEDNVNSIHLTKTSDKPIRQFNNRRVFGMPNKDEILSELISMIIAKGYQTNEYNEWLRDMFLLKPFGNLGEELMCDISRNSLGYTNDTEVISKMKTIKVINSKDDAYKYYYGIAKHLIGEDYYNIARNNIRHKNN